MRTKLTLGIVSALGLFACGGGDSDPIDAPVGTIDSPPGTIDASIDAPPEIDGPPLIDADPADPDAAPGAFTCNGVPNPTTAADPITVAGTTVELSAAGTSPVTGTTVTLFNAAGGQIAQTVSAGATAAFSFTNLATGGTPINGYMRGEFPDAMNGDNRKTNYLFPPAPISADVTNALVTSISDGTVNFLQLAYANPDQMDATGAIGVLVLDCLGNPLENAQIRTNPDSGTQKLYFGANGLPDTMRTSTGPNGLGIILNVPTGTSVVVDAVYASYNMREHTIQVRSFGAPDNALNTTIVAP